MQFVSGPLVLCLVCLFLVTASASSSTSSFQPVWAKSAFSSYVKHFWSAEQQYLLNQFPSNNQDTQYWVAAQGLDTLVDAVQVFPTEPLYRDLVSGFYATQDKIGWLRDWYDDENWMGMALVRAYEATNDARFLARAVSLWKDITTAWDTTCCGPRKGGNWWDKQHTQKATAANAGPVILSLMLHRHFPANPTFLTYADEVYSFWYANMVNLSTFQVADHLTTSGDKVWWKFTYNEGLMIGASVFMYEATSNITYLSIAQRIASFMMSNEVTKAGGGRVLFDGTNGACGGDCMQFKGPAFRYLVALFRALNKLGPRAPTSGPSAAQVRQFLTDNVEALWTYARNTTLDLFSVDWAGPAPVPSAAQPVYQSQQNAATMALLQFATITV